MKYSNFANSYFDLSVRNSRLWVQKQNLSQKLGKLYPHSLYLNAWFATNIDWGNYSMIFWYNQEFAHCTTKVDLSQEVEIPRGCWFSVGFWPKNCTAWGKKVEISTRNKFPSLVLFNFNFLACYYYLNHFSTIHRSEWYSWLLWYGKVQRGLEAQPPETRAFVNQKMVAKWKTVMR